MNSFKNSSLYVVLFSSIDFTMLGVTSYRFKGDSNFNEMTVEKNKNVTVLDPYSSSLLTHRVRCIYNNNKCHFISMLSHEKNKKTLCKLPLSVRSAIT